MLYLVMLLMLQGSPRQEECEAEGGYFREAGQACLARDDQNEDQRLLLKALAEAERELAVASQFQQAYNNANALARLNRYNARISDLGALRDASSGRPAQVYQKEIDRFTRLRNIDDSTEEFDPNVPGSKDSLRTKAGKLEPVIVQLQQDIVELKRELDASF